MTLGWRGAVCIAGIPKIFLMYEINGAADRSVSFAARAKSCRALRQRSLPVKSRQFIQAPSIPAWPALATLLHWSKSRMLFGNLLKLEDRFLFTPLGATLLSPRLLESLDAPTRGPVYHQCN